MEDRDRGILARLYGIIKTVVKKFPSSNLPIAELKSARRAPTHYSNIPPFHYYNCEDIELSSPFTIFNEVKG
jgi:hypothetical protein